jgi:hypothetical protein
MSLFKTGNKWEAASKESVKIKAELMAHQATHAAIKKAYDADGPKVEAIARELSIAQLSGSPKVRGVGLALALAKRDRERGLHVWKLTQTDLRNKLEACVRPFIAEQAAIWEIEKGKAPSMRNFQETELIKRVDGTRTHVASSNLEGVNIFLKMLLERLQMLHGMVESTIPEIQSFIQKTEDELRSLDLTSFPVEVSETAFKDVKEAEGQATEKTNFVTGYGMKDGIHLSGVGKIQTGVEATQTLYNQANVLKERFK